MNYPQQFAAWLEEKVNIESIKKDFVAGVDIPAGCAVYMETDGLIYPYTTGKQDQYIGVTNEFIASHCKCTVTLNGYLKVQGSGWQKGVVYYVHNGGGLFPVVGDAKIAVGVAKDAIVVFNNISEIDYFILTTLGNSGPATLTGGNQLNIPNYTLSGLGGVPSTRTLTINSVTYDLSADRSWTITAGVWGQITGTLSNQTDLWNALLSKVPTSRTLTINGVSYDLTADRSWTIDALPPQAGQAGNFLTTDGVNASWAPVNLSGYVPIGRTLTINGVSYDLSLDRTWTIDALPPQAGNAGEYLTTDGVNASWAPLDVTDLPYVEKTGTYGISSTTDCVINCTSGTFTVTLPTAVGIEGKFFIVKNTGAGLITIDTTSAQTIDGNLSITIVTNESVRMQSTGANYIRI